MEDKDKKNDEIIKKYNEIAKSIIEVYEKYKQKDNEKNDDNER